jgi:general secretion pathway protein B
LSYILEALRKAERERNPTQPDTPRIESRTRFAQISNLQQLRQYRPVLVAGLCFSLMIALTLSLIWHPHSSAAANVITAAQTPPTAAAVQTQSHDPYAALLKQVYGDGNGPATLDDLVDTGSEAASDELPVYSDTDNSARLSDAAAPAINNAADDSVPAEPAPAPAITHPAPVTSVQRVQLDPAPAPQIPKLGDMSVDYRAAFPAISLDVHSYDSAPKKRFIMIAGKRYNEGDALPEGPRIMQIVQDGVVFEFRGEQVLFPMAH